MVAATLQHLPQQQLPTLIQTSFFIILNRVAYPRLTTTTTNLPQETAAKAPINKKRKKEKNEIEKRVAGEEKGGANSIKPARKIKK
ncbi:O-acetyl-ADP-ribose deacetylase 1 [Sesbania bispinosa]|nr:O-acetyl-ADP-ribose deacetylase 1 [Sesbania bispinosa]